MEKTINAEPQIVILETDLPVAYDYPSYVWTFFEKKYNSAYKSYEEFREHFISGDVKVSFRDMMKLYEDYLKQKPIPSRHQIGDKVLFGMQPSDGGWLCPMIGIIIGAHFYQSKVKYDLELGLDEEKTRIYNVDSFYVQPFSEEAYKCYALK